MSFSGGVKEELVRQESGSRSVMLAELAALLAFGGIQDPEKSGRQQLRTEYSGAKERFRRLSERLFGTDAAEGEKLQRLLRELQEPEAFLARREDGRTCPAIENRPDWTGLGLFRRENCRRAFLRGAFLASGSMSDPNRSYHFEIICGDDWQAEQFKGMLHMLEVESRIVHRRQTAVVYVKESEQIARLLGLMEARMSLLEYENIRILREVRGNINRQVNCETANISKTAHAAAQQIKDIRYIAETTGLSKLTNGLDEIAAVRLQYPTATLKELGEYLDPPIGKSGVNHRLRKLSEIAEQLRGTRGGVCND